MNKFCLAIVDDELDFLEILKIMIDDNPDFESFEVRFFSSAEDCLNEIDSIHCILTDINMPKMDGFALMREAKIKKPNIFLTVMSAYLDDSYKERAQQLGASAYFVKPLDFEKVRDQLCTLLKNSRPQV